MARSRSVIGIETNGDLDLVLAHDDARRLAEAITDTLGGRP